MRPRSVCLAALTALTACASHPTPVAQTPVAPAPQVCPAPPPAADPVLAVVEGRRIRESEVTPLIPLFAPSEDTPALSAAERLERTLDVLIDDLVVRATATRRGLSVPDSEVDATVAQVASARGGTVDALFTQVEAQHVSRAQYRAMVESQLLRARLLIALRAQSSVDDAEVELAWRASPEPRTPLREARAALSARILEQRMTCLEHAQIADLRRRMGVEFLLERAHGAPSSEDHTLRFVQTADVRISGNRALTTAEITTILRDDEHRHALGGSFVPIDDEGHLAQELTLRLLAAYYDRGYINARVDNPPERLEPCRSLVSHSLLNLHEGDRFRVGALSFAALDEAGHPIARAPGAPAIPPTFTVHTGDWFSRATIFRAMEAIAHVERDQGYATARIEPSLTPHADTHMVDLALTLQRGPRVTVERVDVQGNGAVSRAEIDRLVMLRVGELFNETQYNATRAALARSGRFDQVEMSTEAMPEHPDRMVVHIELHEGSPAPAAPTPAAPAPAAPH